MSLETGLLGSWGSLGGSDVKESTYMDSICRRPEFDSWVENLLEEGMATHSDILAWRIPRTVEPGGLQSIGSQRD